MVHPFRTCNLRSSQIDLVPSGIGLQDCMSAPKLEQVLGELSALEWEQVSDALSVLEWEQR